MMSQRMHGAKGDVSTSFRQEFMSAIETTGLSENPSSDLTLPHSLVKGFTDTPGPGRREALGSEDKDIGIPDNVRERKEFVCMASPDQYPFGSGTEDTSESSEAGKDGRIEDSGTTFIMREGGARRREHEAGPSGTREDEGEMVMLVELCFCVANKTNIRM
ncbi:hypothetical protein B9Z19DRAFT_687905 [Tuber borchii]|uniref:Uncharacterized protein n=1 Tax=Tuber borchii TaxID=42251 RepID=A0A2T6ZA52_TUBBO|nr:hypothetical protein B9Z19DRAFT_687905 [Tuber borchii]